MKGHAAAPRKRNMKAVASRAVVCIVDEYKTTKRYPNGCGWGYGRYCGERMCAAVLNCLYRRY